MTTEIKMITLPIAIQYYGGASEAEHEFALNYNRGKLKSMGLKLIKTLNQGTDCEEEIWSIDDDYSAFDDGIDNFNIWEGLNQFIPTNC